jgi:hypothetical protein
MRPGAKNQFRNSPADAVKARFYGVAEAFRVAEFPAAKHRGRVDESLHLGSLPAGARDCVSPHPR